MLELTVTGLRDL